MSDLGFEFRLTFSINPIKFSSNPFGVAYSIHLQAAVQRVFLDLLDAKSMKSGGFYRLSALLCAA